MRQTLRDDTIIDMFRKKPVLQYESAIDSYPNIITPTRTHVPEWYKKIPKWKNNEVFNAEEQNFQHSLKQCIPFLDSLSSGYVITLPQDLYVKQINNCPYITWKNLDSSMFPPSWRNSVSDENLVPNGYYPTEYIWQPGVALTIPLGYSMLMTHPFNRFDLPFITLSAIVDGGLVMNSRGNVPFYIKKDFEGVIPKGTPIIQIIPFLQQPWSSKKTKGLVKKGMQDRAESQSIISGWYKKAASQN